jgi:6-phosphogluconolactonase
MKKTKNRLSRRKFLQNLGYVSFAGSGYAAVPNFMAAQAFGSSSSEDRVQYAYVSSNAGPRKEGHGIDVFAVNGGRWERVQSVSSPSPSFLMLHPAQHVLYVANEMDEYQGLPFGTVEAYSISQNDGRLRLLRQQRLSLSGTRPRQIAISPDGKYMAVALYGGGAYNILSLSPDGVPESVTGITKELGSGRHFEHQRSAHPSSVVFDPVTHHLLSADFGCDRLNVFTVSNGKLTLGQRHMVSSGMGPGQLAVHPSGRFLYLTNELDGSISCYRYSRGAIQERLQQTAGFSVPDCVAGLLRSSLALHPSGRFLYSTFSSPDSAVNSGILAWRINPDSGEILPIGEVEGKRISAHSLTITDCSGGLYALDHAAGTVFSLKIDPIRGSFSRPISVARAVAPGGLALKYRV